MIQTTLRIALALLTSLAASAHDLYLMPDAFQVSPGSKVTFSVYSGDGFPTATSKVTLSRLRNPKVHAKAAAPALPAFQLDGVRAISTVETAGKGHLILTVESEERIEGMKAGEFLDYLKEESLNSIIELREKQGEAAKDAKERYTKFSKTIVRVGDGDGYFNQVVGLPIEFVPEKDPLTLKRGENLPVRLLFRGAPAAGIQVVAARANGSAVTPAAPLAVTGKDGRISIPIDGPGQWRLHAIQMGRSADAAADWESFWATLTFEVK